jgi:hypothetical protein
MSRTGHTTSRPRRRPGWRTGRLLAALLAGLGVCAWLEVRWGLYAREPFDEGGLITRVSVLLLAATAVYAGEIWRRAGQGRGVWLLVCLGFIFLALDEKTLIHEGLADLVRDVFGLDRGGPAGRLDDAIMGAYALAAVAVAVRWRKELLRVRASLAYWALGFAGLFATVALDALTHGKEAARALVADPATADALLALARGGEELAKVAAEACFLCALHAVHASLPAAGRALGFFRDRWQWGTFAGLLVLVLAMALEKAGLFFAVWPVWGAPVLAMAAVAWLASRGLGYARGR